MPAPPRLRPQDIAVAAAASLAIAAIVGVGLFADEPPLDAPPMPVAIDLGPPPDTGPPADAGPPPPSWRSYQGTLEPGQAVTSALQAHGVTRQQVHGIVEALKGHYDFRDARPGARFELDLDGEPTADTGTGGALRRFKFIHGALDEFEVVRDPETGALVGQRVEVPVRVTTEEIGAEIRQSLYAAMQRAGESPALVALIVDVFAWDLDFFKDTHPGDNFRVVVEKVYKEDEFIRYGRILAAEYSGKVGTFRTFWFDPEKGTGDPPPFEVSAVKRAEMKPVGGYYLEDGRSARKSFLRTPLKFVRVSSGFGKRRHPILGYTKQHNGVDYAAPTGTPVWAMASGTVKYAGYKGANGNLVVIDHHNGLVSYYAHLHKISRGIKRGSKVDQKRVIGSVGSTGRSTGPHLHFAVKRNGRYVNPARLKMTRGKPISKEQKQAYAAVVEARTRLLAEVAISSAPPPAPEDAAPAALTD
jgi:murein DD-endopeptidase MepM/ murein hydrolase activator NlpD